MGDSSKVGKYLSMVGVCRRATGDAAGAEEVVVCDSRCSANILVTSDIHTSGMDGIDAKGASIVILAGDVMGGGMDSDDAGFRCLEREFFPWCRENSGKHIVLTAGNHDKFLFRMWEKGVGIEWPSNVTYLVDRAATIDGIKMYGTPWCTKDRDGRFEGSDKWLAEKFSKIPEGLDILISHTPPYIPGEKIDYSDWSGLHEGSKELTEEILKKRPKLVVCGHVHGGSRNPIKFGYSTIMNVARVHGDRSVGSCRPKIVRFVFD